MILQHFLLISLLIFSVTACRDQITSGGSTTTVITPPVTPTPDDNISSIPFAGIETISHINQRGFTVNWQSVEGAGSYQIFLATTDGLKHHTTVNHPQNFAVLKNLEIDTQYKVVVRMMDKLGRININEKYLTVRTNLDADYENSVSLFFNGLSSIKVGPSNTVFPAKNVTLSLWFKASERTTVDSRLITLHSGFAASTALSLGVENDQVFYLYKDQQNNLKKVSTSFHYYDNQWHHIALSYNGLVYVLYLDGVRINDISDTNSGYGAHPLTIGAYTGIQKGFVGQIDEVSLWNSAIPENDIVGIFQERATNDLNLHQRVNALRAWFRMGDDENDSAQLLIDQRENFNAEAVGLQASDFLQDKP